MVLDGQLKAKYGDPSFGEAMYCTYRRKNERVTSISIGWLTTFCMLSIFVDHDQKLVNGLSVCMGQTNPLTVPPD